MAEQALSDARDLYRAAVTPDAGIRLSRVIPYVKSDRAGDHTLSLMVDGITCAACIRKIETSLRGLTGVYYVRLNFSTRRLNVSWRGDTGLAETIIDTLTALSYKATPFDPETMARRDEKENSFLLLCLGVAGFAAGNIMLLSFSLWTTDIQTMGVEVRDFLHWVSALIAIPAIAFSGRPFFLSALKALKAGRTNMDVPISVGLILTTGMSLFELAHHGEHAYFDSAVMLMFFLLVGRYLDHIARSKARQAATDLMGMMAGTATVLENGQPRSLLIRDIQPGMMILATAGEYIAVDGQIIEGRTDLDASLVTGESLPVAAGPGDMVMSGTVNLTGPVIIHALRNSEESQVGHMIGLMEKAEASQARYIRIADRAARLYTPVVHTLALIAFLGWVSIGHMPWQDALLIAATVLIITCPCALALAVPIVQVLAVGRLMKQGIMVQSGDVLEKVAGVDTVIFDKTGTLTSGRPVLINSDDIDPKAMQIAASMARYSRHPLSRALASFCAPGTGAIEVEEIPGSGLRASIDGREVRLGRRLWATTLFLPDDMPQAQEIVLGIDGQAPVRFLFRDELRPDARAVIDVLRARGLTLHLLSGDRADIVARMGQALDIASAHGQMTPDDKFRFMEDLHAKGHKIMMVGDGINDAPILAGADVSIAPASGIDIARRAAQVVFTGDRLKPVITVLDMGRLSRTRIRENFIMTIIYNVCAIPLAVAGYVTPLVAALAMSLSSLAVILNAFRLRRAA